MPIRIKARSGESAEQLMRRFKKMCEKEGLTKDVKRRMYYEKPSEKRQRALRKSIKRVQQQELAASGIQGGRGGNSYGNTRGNQGGSARNGSRGPSQRGPRR